MWPQTRGWVWLVLLASFLAPTGVWAEEEDERAPQPRQSSGIREFVKFTRKLTKIDGLFPIYRNESTGEVFLAISADRLGKEFIQFSYTVNAPAEAGTFRGDYRENRVIKIERHFDRLEFIAENTRFYFDPQSPLARASNANIAPAVLASEPIIAELPDHSAFLIDAGDLFLSEKLVQVRPTDDPDNKKGEAFELGKLSDEKTRFEALHNYPENTDIVVDYTYDEPDPLNYGDDDIADGRYVTITVQHSLIEIPKSDYVPRLDDYRVGYFTERRTDLTSSSTAPYADLIQRWNLQKKNPAAALSEPVKPIVFWLENTTPRELRAAVRKGILAWNKALEKAGFKNAIEVRDQLDDALWDAGDIRYNVIRWSSSPNPDFGGYGPSFTNPRTGEIIGADIMLEYVFVTNRLRREEIFSDASSASDSEDLPNIRKWSRRNAHRCDFARRLQHNLMLGRATLKTQGAGPQQIARMIEEAVEHLALHEVGHTLGLTHNMKASSIRALDELQAKDQSKYPLVGSVMDYSPVNLAQKGEAQGVYFQTVPGPYDIWAIEFGYSPTLANPQSDAARVKKLLSRSGDPALAFGIDSDDMSSLGQGIDPRIMTDDLSSNPIVWASNRMRLMNETMSSLRVKFVKPGESYQSLRSAYLVLSAEKSDSADILSRFIGGVYVERTPPGVPGAKPPYTPVPLDVQKSAMATLAKNVFAPDAFSVQEDLARRLQIQRRGFDLDGDTEDPKFHARALAVQGRVLRQILHPTTLERITDSGVYGNKYGVDAVLDDLTKAIFDADRDTNVSSFRQNLQTYYVERLVRVFDDEDVAGRYDSVARAAILRQLRAIDAIEGFRLLTLFDAQTQAHRDHIRLIIARGLEARSRQK